MHLLPFDDFYRDFVDDVDSEYMDKEIKTLEEMGVWEVVKRTPNMRVTPSIFACKIKLTADGLRALLRCDG